MEDGYIACTLGESGFYTCLFGQEAHRSLCVHAHTLPPLRTKWVISLGCTSLETRKHTVVFPMYYNSIHACILLITWRLSVLVLRPHDVCFCYRCSMDVLLTSHVIQHLQLIPMHYSRIYLGHRLAVVSVVLRLHCMTCVCVIVAC
jgi:hypothetical protein